MVTSLLIENLLRSFPSSTILGGLSRQSEYLRDLLLHEDAGLTS